MNKIGIITLYGMRNYGNRLQNYAVSELLSQYGFQTETLVCQRERIMPGIKQVYKRLRALLGSRRYIRWKKIYQFNLKHIPTRTIYAKNGILPKKISNEYKFFVVGSDQIWNLEIPDLFPQNIFLQFARFGQRICLAPSMGIEKLRPELAHGLKKGLLGFPRLSVREKAGQRIIRKLTGIEADVLPDPTMVLTREHWKELADSKRPPEKKQYLLKFFLDPPGAEDENRIAELASRLGLSVIALSDPQSAYYTSGPEEFLWLIGKAALVCSDSFHAIAFSINFNVPFYAFQRMGRKEIVNKIGSRIYHLLETYGLEHRWSKHMDTAGHLECDFFHANQVLEEKRIQFHRYLEDCLNTKTPFAETAIAQEERSCTGCGACAQRCPEHAIRMIENEQGFLIPRQEPKICTFCGLCKESCPVVSAVERESISPSAYAAYHKEERIQKGSSSGGVFYGLASYILKQGGVVFGAMVNEEQEVVHGAVYKIEELVKLQTSKYVQSAVGNAYILAKQLLLQGGPVLFSGTPCQIAAFRRFQERPYENLYTVDFVCHGVPSPRIFRDYLKDTVKGRKVHELTFRDKKEGWESYSMRIGFQDGEPYVRERKADPYLRAFAGNLILREACYQCRFKGTARDSDITLADFWGVKHKMPEMYHKDGVSMVLCQNHHGQRLFDRIMEDYQVSSIPREISLDYCNPALTASSRRPQEREAFFHRYDKAPGIETLEAELGSMKELSLFTRALNKASGLVGK